MNPDTKKYSQWGDRSLNPVSDIAGARFITDMAISESEGACVLIQYESAGQNLHQASIDPANRKYSQRGDRSLNPVCPDVKYNSKMPQ